MSKFLQLKKIKTENFILKEFKKIAEAARAQIFFVEASGNAELSYQWYVTDSEDNFPGTKIENATESVYNTGFITKNGKSFYYCSVTNSGIVNQAVVQKSEKSKMFVVEYFAAKDNGLPILFINTADSAAITSKTDYLQADLSIKDENFPISDIKVEIAGRGNSTWAQVKKPYKFKVTKSLEGTKKESFLGIDSGKQKSWVLLANYFDNSFLKNDITFYLSRNAKSDWTVDGRFVDLVLNGKYAGNYYLCDSIKIDKKRVNVSKDKGLLLELDVYYDEDIKFKSETKNLPYMLKEPDDIMTTGRASDMENFEKYINELEEFLYAADFSTKTKEEIQDAGLDLSSFAKFFLINSIVGNGELGHPKSCYVTYDLVDEKPILKMGPVWDFDWAFLEEEAPAGLFLQNTIYYDALFKNSAFKTELKEIWNEYFKNSENDLYNYINSKRTELKSSVTSDEEIWGKHLDPSNIDRNDFDSYVDHNIKYLKQRFSYLNSEIEKF